MEKNSFDTKKFIYELGKELVSEFEKSSMGTHPHAVGSGREYSVKNKLKNILPAGIGVGSGFVIDSYGHVSQQCDIIIYEENFAMKFIINDDESNTYYNCESVIAVGEVKSTATKKEVNDSIQKLKKIKELKRFSLPGMDYRHYSSSHTAAQLVFNQQDITVTFKRQIYTFMICKNLNTTAETIMDLLKEHCDDSKLYPNHILSIDGNVFAYFNVDTKSFPLTADCANYATIAKTEYAFNNLIMILLRLISIGETVPLNYEPYIGSHELYFDDEKIVKL